jgi:MoaA/NifB/PqqE/SkfB family radical SAM enzyme
MSAIVVPGISRAQYARTGILREVGIDLEVTSVCDATCEFCPREVMPDKKRFLSMELVERLADDIRQTPPHFVMLCGIGEPVLHPQLGRIVQTLAATGVRVEMTTHGGRMSAGRFEELVAQGLSGFNFSLNAVTAETHRAVMRLTNFKQIVATVEEIIDLREQAYPAVSMHVSFVISALNRHEVADFVAFWRDKGLSKIWLHPVNNRNGLRSPAVNAADIDLIARQYAGDEQVRVDVFGDLAEEGDLCKVARKLMFISADGEMRLCAMDYRRITSYGNLMDRRLEDMHREKLLRYLRGEMNGFCAGCDFCPVGIGAIGEHRVDLRE